MKFIVALAVMLSLGLSHNLYSETNKTEEPKWVPIELKMTRPSSKELITLILDYKTEAKEWAASFGDLKKEDISSALCTAKVMRPTGTNDLPLSETLNNKIICKVNKKDESEVEVILSLANAPLERWGTSWLKRAFSIHKNPAEILYAVMEKAFSEIPEDQSPRMLTDDFICDPNFDFCMDGYTLHQTPLVDLEHTTYSALSCDRETDITPETKGQLRAEYKKYREQAALGEEQEKLAKAEFRASLDKVLGTFEDKEMVQDQLKRGVRKTTKLVCTFMETDDSGVATSSW